MDTIVASGKDEINVFYRPFLFSNTFLPLSQGQAGGRQKAAAAPSADEGAVATTGRVCVFHPRCTVPSS